MSMMVNSPRFGAAGGGGGGGTPQDYAVPSFPSPVYVLESASADQTYEAPGGVYVKESAS